MQTNKELAVPQTFEGGCYCKEVRYRLRSEPIFVNCCHCLYCQNQTGSAFVINAMIETDRLELVSGNPEPNAVEAGRGQPHDIYRCPSCGVAVFSDYGHRENIRFVRVGTLDDPTALAPGAHIFTRSKQPWVGLPDDVPSFEVYYDAKELWPPEVMARFRAAMD